VALARRLQNVLLQRVRSPDGKDWELRATRFRLPRWEGSVSEPRGAAPTLDVLWAVAGAVPGVLFVFDVLIALLRGIFDRGRWIEAVCWYPKTRITWRVADRRQLWGSFVRIQDRLGRGSGDLEFEGVRIAAITPPDALRELFCDAGEPGDRTATCVSVLTPDRLDRAR
jgi:hypothetical protein